PSSNGRQPMATTQQIVPTAPLHGIDLARAGVKLPHQNPAPVAHIAAELLEPSGAFATEEGAGSLIEQWRGAADYKSRPVLYSSQAEAVATRRRLAAESVEILGELQRRAAVNGEMDRVFQRKTLYATTTSEFLVPANLPSALAGGVFTP